MNYGLCRRRKKQFGVMNCHHNNDENIDPNARIGIILLCAFLALGSGGCVSMGMTDDQYETWQKRMDSIQRTSWVSIPSVNPLGGQ